MAKVVHVSLSFLLATLAACNKGGGGGGSGGATTEDNGATNTGEVAIDTGTDPVNDTDTKTVTKTDTGTDTDTSPTTDPFLYSDIENAVVAAPAAELVLPSQVAIVTDSGAGASLALASTAKTDLQRHVTSYNSYVPYNKAVQLMNNVLCSVASTGFNEHVNEPAYIAQIDIKSCVTRNDYTAARATTHDGSVYSPSDLKRTDIVVAATKVGKKPLVVKVWYKMKNSYLGTDVSSGTDGGGALIPYSHVYAKITIVKAPSVANPFGQFLMEYQAFPINRVTGVESDAASLSGRVTVKPNEIVVSDAASGTTPRFEFSDARYYPSGVNHALKTTEMAMILDVTDVATNPKLKGGVSLSHSRAVGTATSTDIDAQGVVPGSYNAATFDTALHVAAAPSPYPDLTSPDFAVAPYSPLVSFGFNGTTTEFECFDTRPEHMYQWIQDMRPFKADGSAVRLDSYFEMETRVGGIPQKRGFVGRTGPYTNGAPVSTGDHFFVLEKDDAFHEYEVVDLLGELRDKYSLMMDVTDAQPVGSTLHLHCAADCLPGGGLTSGTFDHGNGAFLSTNLDYIYDADLRLLRQDLGGGNLQTVTMDGDVDLNTDAHVQPRYGAGYLAMELTAGSDIFEYRIHNPSAGYHRQALQRVIGGKFLTFEPFLKLVDRPFVLGTDGTLAPAEASPDGKPMSEIFGGNLYYDGAAITRPNFQQFSSMDQDYIRGAFHQDVYFNYVHFADGLDFVAANTAGNVTAGSHVKLYPGMIYAVQPASDVCTDAMATRLSNAHTEIGALPPRIVPGDKKIKDAIGPTPTGALAVKVVDGDTVN